MAEAIVHAAPNAVTGMTLLRELSDGFQYREVQDGMTRCTHCTDGTVRRMGGPGGAGAASIPASTCCRPRWSARLVEQTVPCPVCGGERKFPRWCASPARLPCPKDAALKMLLDENEETGRLVVFAGFTGSVDRVVKLCLKEKWDVVRCDQGTSRSSRTTAEGVERKSRWTTGPTWTIRGLPSWPTPSRAA